MRILFFSGADQKYGTFHSSIQLLEWLHRTDSAVEFIVVTQQYGPLNNWCKENGYENYVIPYRYCVYYPPTNNIVKTLKHGFKLLVVTISNINAMRKIEKMGLLENVDLIHTNINRDLIGEMLSRKYGIPNVTYLREFSRAHFHLLPIYKNQIKFMNDNSCRFIAISEAVKKDWIEYGIDADKIEIIYDGVDTDKYRIKESSKDNNNLKLVMCGAIYEGKGQFELLKAAGKLIHQGYDIYVDFYGEGVDADYYSVIDKFVESENLSDYVRFNGFINNINDIFEEYDVGVICSKAEGFGLVTVEYLLSGLAVVASDTGANPELLGNGEYGYLYHLGDIDALRETILDLFMKKEAGISLKESAEYAKEKYTIRKTAKDLINLYVSIGENT